MLQKVLETIAEYEMLQTRDRIVLGLSGGMDSMALLYVLLNCRDYRLDCPITAVHVNHGIRGEEAARDEAFVADICHSLDIPLKIYYYDVPAFAREQKISLEEGGRIVRYQAFEDTAREFPGSKIAVAHHLNDQAETVLMRFIRGTGVTGLKGIPAVRDRIIRPLIRCSRVEIGAYVKARDIPFVEDSTNTYRDYTRNRIRQVCIPYIEAELNPNFLAAMEKNSGIARAEDDFLAKACDEAYRECVTTEDGTVAVAIDKKCFQALHGAIQYRVLRRVFENFPGGLKDVEYKHIEMVCGLFEKEAGKTVALPGGFWACNSYDSLIIGERSRPEPFSIPLSDGAFVYVPQIRQYFSLSYGKPLEKLNFRNTCTMVFGCDKIIDNLFLRSRLPGDRIYIKSMGGRKKIKDYFIDGKVPRNRRDQAPLLAAGNEVLWILDEKRIGSDRYKEDCGQLKMYAQLWEAVK